MVLLKLSFIQGLSTQPRVNFRDRDTGASSFFRYVAAVERARKIKGGCEIRRTLLPLRWTANDEKLELPSGNSRAVRLRGLSFPTRVGSPRRASALRKAICDLFSDLEFVYWAEAF